MFIDVWNGFKTQYESQINKQTEEDNTKLFWQVMEGKYKKIRETSSDLEWPETEGLDGYDVMNEIKRDGWTVLSDIGEWPYSIYAYKGAELLHYIEGDIFIYNF